MSVPGAEHGPAERARLRSVDAAPSAAPARRDEPRRSRLVAALVAALALAVGLLVWQWLRADALGRRVDALTGELLSARAEIRAHEARLELVRGYVDDLSTQLEALRQLVARDPAAGEPTASEPASADPAE